MVLEAQNVPGGRVQTLRAPFADGLYAEAGASRIPTSHDLPFDTLASSVCRSCPSHPLTSLDSLAYGQRTKIGPGAAFQWPADYRPSKANAAAEVRRRHIDAGQQITSPFAADWMPASFKQYDGLPATSICVQKACPKRRCA